MDMFPAFIADLWCGSEIFIGIFDSADHADDACKIMIKTLKEMNPQINMDSRYEYYYAPFQMNQFNLDALDALM